MGNKQSQNGRGEYRIDEITYAKSHKNSLKIGYKIRTY